MSKPHERRAAGNYPYYKIAVWDARLHTFKDGSLAWPSEAFARIECNRHGRGRYRISEVTADGRRDLEPFEVT